MDRPHFAGTEAVVVAIREVARAFDLEVRPTDGIGADHASRRTPAGAFSVIDPDGSLPHEAFVELSGSPAVTIQVFPDDDAKITVDGVEFPAAPCDSVARLPAVGPHRDGPCEGQGLPARLVADCAAARRRDLQGTRAARNSVALAQPQRPSSGAVMCFFVRSTSTVWS